MNKIEKKGQFIWNGNTKTPNQHVVLKKDFVLETLPNQAYAYIAVDTKYWLEVNGTMVIFEGGLFRESLPGSGYTDKIDLAPYLIKGENRLSVYVHYYGNGGRNSSDSGSPSFLFQCDEISLYSDDTFRCTNHPAYYNTGKPQPAYLYGGHNIGYDGRKTLEEKEFVNAIVLTKHSFGEMYERPVPLTKLMDLNKGEYTNVNDNVYSLKLPYAMAMSPCFVIQANEGTVIDIRTDRYTVPGGPGDNANSYNSHRIEYICRDGENEFKSQHYLFGEEIIFKTDKPIQIKWLGYKESGYDTDIVGSYDSSCQIMNKLVEKSARTLYVCMRDNFMDCPDRERGQWIGDVSVQAPQVFSLLSLSARALLKKSIMDFINLRKADVLLGNVPGDNFSELPSQSLNAISELGMISNYYKYTGDKQVIEASFEPCIKYLKLWDMDSNGLITHRNGDWDWQDHLHNVDKPVLSNAWYYSALKFALKMSDILNEKKHDQFLESRIKSIKLNFNRLFWKENYYSSEGVVDDRANALTVLVGLCPQNQYNKIKFVLQTTFNASIYMEGYVLAALCEMGFYKDAYLRLRSRYYNLAVNENSTLWEDFYVLGTKNHAWSGSPATIAFKYFMGIDTTDGFNTFTANPVPDLFEYQKIKFMLSGGELITLEYKNNKLIQS
ncbi:MAG: hypothetical protein OCD02_07225 [Spirochaetaceae bacterium]